LFLGNSHEAENGTTLQQTVNTQEQTATTEEWLGKQVTMATDTHERMVSSAQSMPRSYAEDNWGNQVSYVWESVMKRCSWKGAIVQSGLVNICYTDITHNSKATS
jgi:hypothetical protein